MKSKTKPKRRLPEIFINGDLDDVKVLNKAFTRKINILLFRDGDTGMIYTEINKKIRELDPEKVAKLEKKYNLIFFNFYPSRKVAEPEPAAPAEPVEALEGDVPAPEMATAEGEPVKKEKRVKKAKKGSKEKKEKKGKKEKKARKAKK